MKNFFKGFFRADDKMDFVKKNIELEDRVQRAEDMSKIFQELYNNAVARETMYARSGKQFEEMYLDTRRELNAVRAVTIEQDRLIDILRKQVEALSK